VGKAVGRGHIPPPQAWKNPLQRAIEDIDVPIEELVEIARDFVEHPVTHPPPPPGSGMGRRIQVPPIDFTEPTVELCEAPRVWR
jgi:hypothetical protein